MVKIIKIPFFLILCYNQLRRHTTMYLVELEALDGNPITPRTGKNKVMAKTVKLPTEGDVLMLFYIDEDCESPGVRIATDCIDQIEDEYKFFDDSKRPFKIKLIKKLGSP